jgi:hypothetical protein
MSDFRVTHRAVGGTLFSGAPSSGELLIEIHLSMGGSDAAFPELQRNSVLTPFGFI